MARSSKSEKPDSGKPDQTAKVVALPGGKNGELAVGQFESEAERDEVHASIRQASVAQVIIAVAVVLAICYLAKLVLVTIFMSVLLAFILEPLVRGFSRLRLPRSVGSLLALLILGAMLWGLSYFFYARAVDFAQQLPRYSGKIRSVLAKYQKSSEDLKKSAEQVLPASPQDQNAVKVKVQESTGVAGMVRDSFGRVTEIALATAFVPFLAYFMLTWQEHARRQTVRLFPPEHRKRAYETLGKISDMMRSFIFGNFLIGIFLGIGSMVVFGFLHLQYFYFLGFISGFLSLVPYLGVILAVIPPLTAGAMDLHLTGLLAVLGTVLGLHIFAMNVLYPKVLGKRLELNPLVVTLGLLLWGWMWGAMGLILAVPILGALKIVCDNVEGLRPFGDWMGD
jgi:predicted PurR-regulated permease PerM